MVNVFLLQVVAHDASTCNYRVALTDIITNISPLVEAGLAQPILDNIISYLSPFTPAFPSLFEEFLGSTGIQAIYGDDVE